jgi:hypothetical protein
VTALDRELWIARAVIGLPVIGCALGQDLTGSAWWLLAAAAWMAGTAVIAALWIRRQQGRRGEGREVNERK